MVPGYDTLSTPTTYTTNSYLDKRIARPHACMRTPTCTYSVIAAVQNQLGFVHSFVLDLLNTEGGALKTPMMYDRTIYPAGTSDLIDPVRTPYLYWDLLQCGPRV